MLRRAVILRCEESSWVGGEPWVNFIWERIASSRRAEIFNRRHFSKSQNWPSTRCDGNELISIRVQYSLMSVSTSCLWRCGRRDTYVLPFPRLLCDYLLRGGLVVQCESGSQAPSCWAWKEHRPPPDRPASNPRTSQSKKFTDAPINQQFSFTCRSGRVRSSNFCRVPFLIKSFF